MTDYTDIPDANMLHQQREVVTNAIAVLDDGGSLSYMSVAPRPLEPGEAPPMGPMMMGTQVQLPPPTPPTTVAAVRDWLVQRQADLDAQLAAMGITNPPEAAAAATKGAKR
jgi:hypothetical protein